MRSGDIVAMIGASLYNDGVLRFWAGGKAADNHALAVEMSKELAERIDDLLQ